MNSIRILIVLIIILGLVIFGQRFANQSKENNQSEITESDSPTPTLNSTISPTHIPTTYPPTSTPTTIPTVSPTPANSPANQSLNISDFRYPDSIIISEDGNKLELENNDDPKKVTDWYKDRIKSKDLNVTSFVQTSTNGNILNKLVGANSNTEVRVEITKQSDSGKVKISISLIP
jgi:hypothetical protein